MELEKEWNTIFSKKLLWRRMIDFYVHALQYQIKFVEIQSTICSVLVRVRKNSFNLLTTSLKVVQL